MHDFNASNRTARRPKRFETQHGMRDTFDRSMVLLHEVVEIFRVAEDDSRLVGPIVALDRCAVRTTLVDGDLPREPLVSNSLTQEGCGGVPIAIGREQKINSMAFCVAA